MKKLLSVFLLMALYGLIFASEIGERLETILSKPVSVELMRQGSITYSSYRKDDVIPYLNPEISIVKEALAFWTGEKAPFFSEALYLYKKPVNRQGNPGIDIEKISVTLRSLSHLQGIEYYSNSRKKMRILYEKSYVVDSQDKKTRLSDPVQGSADGLSVLALQKDLTFGEYLYNYSYRQTSDSIGFFSQNMDSMNYSLFKVIDPGKLRISLVVHDMGDYLLVYGLTRADFPAIPGLEGKLNLSFTSRTEAMYIWFIKEYEKQKE